jgi:predicted enzyme related to lactoylglutathione lyase
MLGKLRQVILPVGDVDAAVAHYRDELGLPLQFQDGARWAAFKLGDLTLGVAGPGEHPAEGDEIALGIKVTNLDAAVDAIVTSGGKLLGPPCTGEHERRASVRDRFGTLVALYEPLAK